MGRLKPDPSTQWPALSSEWLLSANNWNPSTWDIWKPKWERTYVKKHRGQTRFLQSPFLGLIPWSYHSSNQKSRHPRWHTVAFSVLWKWRTTDEMSCEGGPLSPLVTSLMQTAPLFVSPPTTFLYYPFKSHSKTSTQLLNLLCIMWRGYTISNGCF